MFLTLLLPPPLAAQAGVVGLTDAALADCLEQLPALRSLAISAAGNRAGGETLAWAPKMGSQSPMRGPHPCLSEASSAAVSLRFFSCLLLTLAPAPPPQ